MHSICIHLAFILVCHTTCEMSELIIKPTEVSDPAQVVEPRQGDYPAGKVFGSLIGVALVAFLPAWWFIPTPSSASPRLGDLSGATIAEIRTVSGTVVMSGEFRNRVDALGNVEKDAALLGSQRERVIGEIEIEIPRQDSTDPRQELEVDVISLQPRSSYHVFINDRPVATFTTDDRGSIDVEFLAEPSPSR
jgi:hypothetical protein